MADSKVAQVSQHKTIKNDSYAISKFMYMLNNGMIRKPKFQRKRKWTPQPERNNTPNEREYIEFLYKNHNSVHPISLGQKINGGAMVFSNIDGNNRINAVFHYFEKPFEIFPEYLKELALCLNNLSSLTKEDANFIMHAFYDASYRDIVSYRRFRDFCQLKDIPLMSKDKLSLNDGCNIDDIVEEIREKLLIKTESTPAGEDADKLIQIAVNIFEGYTTSELCEVFSDINQYAGNLTEQELLASRLYDVDGFRVSNAVIFSEIVEAIKQYYINNAKDEVLECYKYDNTETLNGYDFMVGLQNRCHNKYGIIEPSDNKGTSIFFKLWKCMNGDDLENSFTTINVDNFIDCVEKSSAILADAIDNMVPKIIKDKILNKKYRKALKSLKKNTVYLLYSAIIGMIKKGYTDPDISRCIKKTIQFHLMIKESSDKEFKDSFKPYNKIAYEAGGKFIDNLAGKCYRCEDSDARLDSKLTRSTFETLLKQLMKENYNPGSIWKDKENSKKISKAKRRDRKFYEYCLYGSYYSRHILTEAIRNNIFWSEHIFPFSSSWDENVDINRLGNTVPVIDKLNNKRKNNHIANYDSIEKELDIESSESVRRLNLIPTDEEYDNIITHDKYNWPHITNINEFNSFCEKNETIYLECFLDQLFN